MKLNWGFGIVVTALLFMAFIVTLVVKTYSFKVDLVADDYYNQELHYQDKINSMNNVKNAEDKVQWKLVSDEIVFTFPEKQNVEGYIEFFRPSDSAKDKKFAIELDSSNVQSYNTGLLAQGLYRLKIDWTVNEKSYYTEEDIYIP